MNFFLYALRRRVLVVQRETKEILQKSKFRYVLFVVRKDLGIPAVINFHTVRMIGCVIAYTRGMCKWHIILTLQN